MDEFPAIPGYEVRQALGRGASGSVFRARDPKLGRDVAVKVLHAGDADGQSRGRFHREARLLLGLRHEALLPLLDADLEHVPAFLVFPLMEGGDLAGRIRSGRAVSTEEVVETGLRLAGALTCLHAAGVVHRDVKPANVLLDEAGRPWLGDLGLGRSESLAALTGTGMMVGTPHYMAPEVFEGGEHGPASDLFALGITLLELARGRLLDGVAIEAGVVAGALDGLADQGLARALRPLLRISPEDRPRDLAGIEAALRGAMGGPVPGRGRDQAGTLSIARARPPPSGPSTRRRSPAWHLAAVLLAALGMGAAARLALRPATDASARGDDAGDPMAAARAALEDPAYVGQVRAELAGLPPGTLARCRDPEAWPVLMARLPSLGRFETWLAGGGPSLGLLSLAAAARLAALDRDFEAQDLPRPFGPAVEPSPTGGWKALQQESFAAARAGLAEFEATLGRGLADPRTAVDEEHRKFFASLRKVLVLVSGGTSDAAAILRLAWRTELWAPPDQQRAFLGRSLRASSYRFRRALLATLVSLRTEPATRNQVLDAYFEGYVSLVALHFDAWLYQEPEALLLGGPRDLREEVVAGCLFERLERVRQGGPDEAGRCSRLAMRHWDRFLAGRELGLGETDLYSAILQRDAKLWGGLLGPDEMLATVARLLEARGAEAPELVAWMARCPGWVPADRAGSLAHLVRAEAVRRGYAGFGPEERALLDQYDPHRADPGAAPAPPR